MMKEMKEMMEMMEMKERKGMMATHLVIKIKIKMGEAGVEGAMDHTLNNATSVGTMTLQ
jgi:hypothetical protein